MLIGDWEEAVFIARPNRFLAEVKKGRERSLAHLPDPGRRQERLVPGVEVRLVKATKPGRRTSYTLIGIRGPAGWVNVDSRLPNLLFEEALASGELDDFRLVRSWRKDVRAGGSVIDFMLEGEPPCLVEVKGCNLVVWGTALFPDAPTTRGTRHLRELAEARGRGLRACVVFVVKGPDARELVPNRETDPAFADALEEAVGAGVEALAYLAPWEGREIRLGSRLPVSLRC